MHGATGATRCTDSREIWRGRRARGSSWLCIISFQAMPGWESGSQNIKKFHFWQRITCGQTPWPISKSFMGFYAHRYPAEVFQIFHDSLHMLRSYCWETARRSFIPIFFRAHCRKNCALDRKMIGTFLMASTFSIHHAKFEGRSYNARRL